MDAADRSSANRTYNELHPQSEWVRESGSNTLIIDLPGFKKEHLKVQLDNIGNLKISGERPPAGDNNGTRFRKDFLIPENSNLNDIRAKFEKGTLYVIIPTTITQTLSHTHHLPTLPPAPQKAPSTQKDETEKKARGDVPEQKTKPEPSPETAGTVTSTGKEKKGSPAGAETPLGAASCEPARAGVARTLVAKMKRPNQLVVNMLVSFLVVVGIGIYAAYKFKAATGKRNLE